MSQGDADLAEVLERSRRRGFLGDADPALQVEHAQGFADAAELGLGRVPSSFADLGTGGGVPGLVLARRWPAATGLLVEASARRCRALRDALATLGLGGRVEVEEARAEDVAHDARYRERYEVVTARGFAAPPVTAEVASGLLGIGGVLVVSEPPAEGPSRWPREKSVDLGLGPATVRTCRGAHYVTLPKLAPVPGQFPRRRGRARKRPLW